MGIFDKLFKKEPVQQSKQNFAYRYNTNSKSEEHSENEKLLLFLKERISDNSNLDDIIKAFEEMCNIPVEDDMILFETGTYPFTDEPMFNFCLVRQIPNIEEEEYYQIHVVVLYDTEERNKNYQQTAWNENLEENIFDFIRNSQEYFCCKDKRYKKVEIYIDET